MYVVGYDDVPGNAASDNEAPDDQAADDQAANKDP